MLSRVEWPFCQVEKRPHICAVKVLNYTHNDNPNRAERRASLRGFGGARVVASAAAHTPLSITCSGRRMVISGLIDTADEMIAKYDELANEFGSAEVMFKNCDGGDVRHGLAFYNHVRASGVPNSAIVRGYTASMGAYLLMAFDAVYVEPFARVMFHEVRVSEVAGTASDLRAIAEQMDDLNSDLATVMAQGIKKTKDEVQATYFDGKDHWLNTDQIVAMGIAKPYRSGVFKSDPISATLTGDAITAAYKAALPSDKLETESDTMKKKVQFVAVLLAANPQCKLTAESDEDVILGEVTAQANALTAANARITALETAEAEAQEARATELVTSAINANKIDKAQEVSFLALAKKDYAATADILGKMTAHATISGQLNKDGKPVGEEFKGKSFKEISAAAGGPEYLAKLEKSDKDRFNKMKASYSEVVE